MRHIYNVVKDIFNPRDHTAPPNKPSTAVKVSFRSQVPYIKDQGQEGSCTGHAGSELFEMLVRNHPSHIANPNTLRFSPQFLYGQGRTIEGTFSTDAGMQTRTIYQVLTKIGCCLESEDPYSDQNALAPDTAAQIAEASAFKIGAYHRILDVDTAKTVLQSGYTFTIGIPVFQTFESSETASTGLVHLPKSSDTAIGGHEMHVIGCDDSKNVFGHIGAFEVQNSWGQWGDNGFCWIPYDYFIATAGQWDMFTAHFGRPW